MTLARALQLVCVALVALAWTMLPCRAHAGHELPFYPSFYPQGIRIERVDPASAAALLGRSAIHAYVGADPLADHARPKDVTAVESLGSYVVASFNASSLPDRTSRCAAAATLRARAASVKGDWVFHPYPVTPFDADFLQHADLARAARGSAVERAASATALPPIRVRARGRLAEAIAGGQGAHDAGDATVEEIDIARLAEPDHVPFGGWPGNPWRKTGWFHAWRLLEPALVDAAAKQAVAAAYERLVSDGPASEAERFEAERHLVSALTAGCERVVLGYTVKREWVSTEYSQGVENIGSDAEDGLDSAIFVRTVKLKDFPWNGWLNVGVATAPDAAWNPIAGFSDAAGRLVWAALADPAFLPAPRGSGFLPNRVTGTVTMPRSAIDIPTDAVKPEPGSGALVRVGSGKRAALKVDYRVLGSAFHDGSRMTAADVLYPYALAYRWGARSDARDWDPAVSAASALVRDRLAGIRLVKVDTVVREFGDVKFVYDVPVLEVYLTRGAGTADETAAIAPPWSAVPWQLTALMEEAVRRGLGAFSAGAARSSTATGQPSVPWLDLARDPKLLASLASLIDTFRTQAFVPAPLAGMVTANEARARWSALKTFYEGNHHLLVTSGPYRLKQWSKDAVVLEVFRDLSYPIGVGTFDEHAIPLRAYVAKTDDLGDRIEVRAEVERVSKFGRSYEIVREPLPAAVTAVDAHEVPVCRYVVLGPGGDVVRAGTAPRAPSGAFTVDLAGLAAPGSYTVQLALVLGGNAVQLEIVTLSHAVKAR
jgi:hypothetical protein